MCNDTEPQKPLKVGLKDESTSLIVLATQFADFAIQTGIQLIDESVDAWGGIPIEDKNDIDIFSPIKMAHYIPWEPIFTCYGNPSDVENMKIPSMKILQLLTFTRLYPYLQYSQ